MSAIHMLANENAKCNHSYVNRMYPAVSRDKFNLCADARKVLNDPNAGGNSVFSEALSCELLHRLYNAQDVRTEMEIEYVFDNWKICDYLITIYGQRVGVSVTRAMKYPDPGEFTLDDATELLERKLHGLILARNGVCDCDSWFKSYLHIWCQTDRIAHLLTKAYSQVDASLTDSVIVGCTVIYNSNYLFAGVRRKNNVR